MDHLFGKYTALALAHDLVGCVTVAGFSCTSGQAHSQEAAPAIKKCCQKSTICSVVTSAGHRQLEARV